MSAIIDHRRDLLHSRHFPSPDFAKGPIPPVFFVNCFRDSVGGYVRSVRYATRDAATAFERAHRRRPWAPHPSVRIRVTMKRPA